MKTTIYSFQDLNILLELDKKDRGGIDKTEVEKLKDVQSREKDDLAKKQMAAKEKARQKDFQNKEIERKKASDTKERERQELRRQSELKREREKTQKENYLPEGSSSWIADASGKDKRSVEKEFLSARAAVEKANKGSDNEGYTGDIDTLDGIKFADKIFNNRKDAQKYVLDHTEKWGHALAVQYKDGATKKWLIGGWLAE